MKKTRYTEEQIIGAIKEHEAGAKVDDICRKRAYPVGRSTTGGANMPVWK